jgi:hypothetical protein
MPIFWNAGEEEVRGITHVVLDDITDMLHTQFPYFSIHRTFTVAARTNTGIVGSKPTRGTDIYSCFFSVCVVGSSPVQGVLQTVNNIHSSGIIRIYLRLSLRKKNTG